jgi:uncharacterized protein (TIGR03435 family)
MTQRLADKLGFRRKLLLASIAIATVAVPVVFGLVITSQIRAAPQAQNTVAAASAFEVATIKRNNSSGSFGMGDGRTMFRIGWGPDRFTATDVSLLTIIQMAYDVQFNQISGGPYWLRSEIYAIEAKMDESAANELHKLSPDQRQIEQQRMLQALLVDRCKLSVHRETKDLPEYVLTVAKNGPKLREAKPDETYSNGIKGPDGRTAGAGVMVVVPGQLTAQGIPIAKLVWFLKGRRELGHRMVLDQTGLTGNYDFTLQWTPESPTSNGIQGPDSATTPGSSGPSLFTALQEQLGLKLESTKAPVDVLVIDHVERPSEN